MNIVKTIQDKYKQTLAKIYVDFGRTYYPVAQAYADMLNTLVPTNESCTAQCISDNCVDVTDRWG